MDEEDFTKAGKLGGDFQPSGCWWGWVDETGEHLQVPHSWEPPSPVSCLEVEHCPSGHRCSWWSLGGPAPWHPSGWKKGPQYWCSLGMRQLSHCGWVWQVDSFAHRQYFSGKSSRLQLPANSKAFCIHIFFSCCYFDKPPTQHALHHSSLPDTELCIWRKVTFLMYWRCLVLSFDLSFNLLIFVTGKKGD